ncbi:hypothetical protein [Bifidobacterium biavatii]|uniref:ABC transporter ATP-binding protein n=1 Tax=Bifidobacterium biavatii DSM 23969 TaxID=1437608 RepID=A0A086ZYL9_9BIFI|nr:hypothetical protein [Bifidobacterium biavatii]KFI51619.1 ABC transporter ATP-binding protein [Bifidobacterium biavatii DSM 23969]
MRLGSIISEALRNIGSGTAHAVIMFLAVLLAGTLLGGYEAASVIGLEREATTRITAFADTTTIMGAAIDGSVCDRLPDAANGPSMAGAMRVGDQLTPASTPGKDIASYQITPGMIDMLTANDSTGRTDADASGIWVSSDVARDFGLAVGGPFDTNHGTATVAGVFDWPNDGRDTRFVYAILVPVSATDGTFTECWAKQWPASDQTETLLYSTVVASDGQNPAGVMAVNKGFDSHYDAQSGYLNRMTRWTPFAALAVGLLLGIVAVRRRRLEYAGALHSGQTKGAQLLGITLETLIWGGSASAASASLLIAYCARMSQSDPAAVLVAALRTPVALFAGVMVASVLSGLTIRESQLFRFFKNR